MFIKIKSGCFFLHNQTCIWSWSWKASAKAASAVRMIKNEIFSFICDVSLWSRSTFSNLCENHTSCLLYASGFSTTFVRSRFIFNLFIHNFSHFLFFFLLIWPNLLSAFKYEPRQQKEEESWTEFIQIHDFFWYSEKSAMIERNFNLFRARETLLRTWMFAIQQQHWPRYRRSLPDRESQIAERHWRRRQ